MKIKLSTQRRLNEDKMSFDGVIVDPTLERKIFNRVVELERAVKEIDRAIRKSLKDGDTETVDDLTQLKASVLKQIEDANAYRYDDDEEEPKKPEDPPKPPERPEKEKNKKDNFDPFEEISRGEGGEGNQPPSREEILDAIKRRLNELSGNSKRGALDALDELSKSILTNSNTKSDVEESLTEGYESRAIRSMDDDEFADYYNEIMSKVNRVTPIHTTRDSEEVKEIVTKKIGFNTDDIKELAAEDEYNRNEEKRKEEEEIVKKKAMEGEEDRYRYSKLKPINSFYLDLTDTVDSEIEYEEEEEETYLRPDRRNEDPRIVRKGTVYNDVLKENKPVIDLYFDFSASWGSSESLELGDRITTMLVEYKDRGEIELNIFYFYSAHAFGGPVITTTRPRIAGGWTYCWESIQKNIERTKANNVVIMTDGDMVDQAMCGQTLSVPGHVWYLFNGKNSSTHARDITQLPKHLYGKSGTDCYKFS